MDTQLGTTPDALARHVDPVRSGASPQRLYLWAGVLVAGPILLLLLKLFPGFDLIILNDPVIHVLIAGSAAILGAILALMVLYVARHANDGRVFLIGMGFLSIASIFIIHAVATPSVLMTGGGLATSWSSVISLSLGSVFFVLSGLNLSVSANRWLMYHARTWLLVFLLCWLTYAYVFLVALPSRMPVAVSSSSAAASAAPPQVDSTVDPALETMQTQGNQGVDMPSDGTTSPVTDAAASQASRSFLDSIRIALVLGGLSCYAFATWRHFSLYRRLPSPAGLATVWGIALFGEALLTQLLWVLYGVSFWLSHVEEFAGFGIISYAMLIAYRRGQTDEGLLESLFLPGTRARIQAGYSQAMDALVDALARGEQPTPTLRVALKRQFTMSESQVQVLERAAEAVAKERQQRQELERLNAELRQLERAKTNFTQMLVHDLKTPLTALIGFIEILRLDSLTDDQRMLVEGSLRSGKNLSGLIGDLLDISRLEEGRLDLSLSLVPPRDLFEECATEMNAWLEQDAKTIQIEAPNELPLLHVDVQLIRRVVLNLVSNAIKHTPAGTRITLRAYRSAGPALDDEDHNGQPGVPASAAYIALEVEDNGPGIAAEYLGRIFEKFEQTPRSRHARQDSTGLGLTFCRLAVEAHGGTITVESAVNVGTTFRAVLAGR